MNHDRSTGRSSGVWGKMANLVARAAASLSGHSEKNLPPPHHPASAQASSTQAPSSGVEPAGMANLIGLDMGSPLSRPGAGGAESRVEQQRGGAIEQQALREQFRQWRVKKRLHRAKLWPKPKLSEPRWSSESQRFAKNMVSLAFSKLKTREDAARAMAYVYELAARAPADKGDSHLRWVDTHQDQRAFRPLIAQASWAESQEAVSGLLEMGADPDAKDENGDSPIWNAMRRAGEEWWRAIGPAEQDEAEIRSQQALADCEGIVRLLLEAGADPNGAGSESRADSQPVLFLAAKMGSAPLVRLLLDFGADVDARGVDGEPLLCWLAREGLPKGTPLFEALAKAGADLEARGASGDTALMIAGRRHQTAASKELLRLGAREDALSRNSRTWRQLAMESEGDSWQSDAKNAEFMEFLALRESLELKAAMGEAGYSALPENLPESREAKAENHAGNHPGRSKRL